MCRPYPVSRRRVLQACGAASLLGLGASTAHGFDWLKLFGKRMPETSGVVKFIEGKAFANQRPLALGHRVPAGAYVTVARESKVIISVADGSVFTLYGGSQLELVVGRMGQGLLNLLAGALLLVVPKGARYVVGGSSASFGIKGTVVYREIFTPQTRTARTMEGTMEVPPRFGGYFCLCHGQVDYLADQGRETFFSDTATHHNSYFIGGEEAGDTPAIQKAPMLNHTDADIRRLVSYQDGPRHDLGWLIP